jgi:threonylcarbamoyladenosine tRNA methylthiotransferase MtaB
VKVFLTALGCKLNQAEVDRFAEQFLDAGYSLASDAAAADLALIHTCTVTQVADRKSRQVIRQVKRANPQARVLVSGCYAHTSPGALAGLAEVDLVVSQVDQARLVDLARSIGIEPEPLLDGQTPHPLPFPRTRTRAFVKIQDGCNDFCTYCIIPYARGRVRSVPVEEVIADITRKLARGFREIVLTGVSIGAYGQDHGPRRATTSLARLVEAVLRQTSVERLRLSSLEPHDFEPELIPFFREERLCPHLHLCLQSGSDSVLRRMRRRYDTTAYAALVAALRAANPKMSITTDVIVGFPGETDEEFAETLAFVEQMGFASLHVFRYSPRPGTRAATFPDQVPEPVKRARSEALLALGERLAQATRARLVGERCYVLFETPTQLAGTPAWLGLTEHYHRTVVPATLPLEGRIAPVMIEGVGEDGVVGRLAGEAV